MGKIQIHACTWATRKHNDHWTAPNEIFMLILTSAALKIQVLAMRYLNFYSKGYQSAHSDCQMHQR